MKRAPVPAVVIILAVVVAVALMGAVLALADGSSSPPECPAGLVCDGYPGPYPYPAPYPAPEYLPLAVMESYPAP